MTETMSAAPVEVPFFFRSGSEDLSGILTLPTGEPRGLTMLLLWGSGGHPSFGSNRLLRRLATMASELGYHAVRFDYPGTGDSSGGKPALHSLQEPAVAPDILEATRWVEAEGLGPSVLVGNCFGGRAVLAAVPEVERLAGVALISPPVWDNERHMELAVFQGKAPPNGAEWVSPRVTESVAHLDRNGVPLLMLYGRPDANYRIFSAAREERLGRLLESGDRVKLVVSDGPVHDFPTLVSQDEFTQTMRGWLDELREDGT